MKMPPRVEVVGEMSVWASILLRMSTTTSAMARFIDSRKVLLREICMQITPSACISLTNDVILQVRLCFLRRSFAVHGWSLQQARPLENRLRVSVAQEISLRTCLLGNRKFASALAFWFGLTLNKISSEDLRITFRLQRLIACFVPGLAYLVA